MRTARRDGRPGVDVNSRVRRMAYGVDGRRVRNAEQSLRVQLRRVGRRNVREVDGSIGFGVGPGFRLFARERLRDGALQLQHKQRAVRCALTSYET